MRFARDCNYAGGRAEGCAAGEAWRQGLQTTWHLGGCWLWASDFGVAAVGNNGESKPRESLTTKKASVSVLPPVEPSPPPTSSISEERPNFKIRVMVPMPLPGGRNSLETHLLPQPQSSNQCTLLRARLQPWGFLGRGRNRAVSSAWADIAA